MDNRGGKRTKEERIKLRKKLLENGTSFESSKVTHVPSANYVINENSMKEITENKKHKLSGKKRKEKNAIGADSNKVGEIGSHEEDGFKEPKYEKLIGGNQEKKKRKLSKEKREKLKVSGGANIDKIDQLGAEDEEGSKKLKYENSVKEITENKKHKLSGKKRKDKTASGADSEKVGQIGSHEEDGFKEPKHGNLATRSAQSEISETKNSARVLEADIAVKRRARKSKRGAKKKIKDEISIENVSKVIKGENECAASEVYHISSVDVESSKGMKKWINEYYQRRPGVKILQERIDEYITCHEEQEEQEKKEREARAAEGGWTVVVHQKGRKKSTDAESGISVGGVAQAAVVDKMGKKKSKDVGLDFYRFQKREAQRNEIMLLQSKFEQDKKRIQQLRAARKFRPY